VDVLSGEFKAFDSRRDVITPDVVLASAAIPTLFRSVRVQGSTFVLCECRAALTGMACFTESTDQGVGGREAG
jgi:hypothetical protein